MKFTIPEDYIVEEVPEKAVVTMPEKSAKFTYHIVNSGNILMINSKFEIKKTLFVAEDYASLKEFYNLMIQKHAEQVVLKKKT